MSDPASTNGQPKPAENQAANAPQLAESAPNPPKAAKKPPADEEEEEEEDEEVIIPTLHKGPGVRFVPQESPDLKPLPPPTMQITGSSRMEHHQSSKKTTQTTSAMSSEQTGSTRTHTDVQEMQKGSTETKNPQIINQTESIVQEAIADAANKLQSKSSNQPPPDAPVAEITCTPVLQRKEESIAFHSSHSETKSQETNQQRESKQEICHQSTESTAAKPEPVQQPAATVIHVQKTSTTQTQQIASTQEAQQSQQPKMQIVQQTQQPSQHQQVGLQHVQLHQEQHFHKKVTTTSTTESKETDAPKIQIIQQQQQPAQIQQPQSTEVHQEGMHQKTVIQTRQETHTTQKQQHSPAHKQVILQPAEQPQTQHPQGDTVQTQFQRFQLHETSQSTKQEQPVEEEPQPSVVQLIQQHQQQILQQQQNPQLQQQLPQLQSHQQLHTQQVQHQHQMHSQQIQQQSHTQQLPLQGQNQQAQPQLQSQQLHQQLQSQQLHQHTQNQQLQNQHLQSQQPQLQNQQLQQHVHQQHTHQQQFRQEQHHYHQQTTTSSNQQQSQNVPGGPESTPKPTPLRQVVLSEPQPQLQPTQPQTAAAGQPVTPQPVITGHSVREERHESSYKLATKIAGDEAWIKEERASSGHVKGTPWSGKPVTVGRQKQWPPPEHDKVYVPYKSPVLETPPAAPRFRPPQTAYSNPGGPPQEPTMNAQNYYQNLNQEQEFQQQWQPQTVGQQFSPIQPAAPSGEFTHTQNIQAYPAAQMQHSDQSYQYPIEQPYSQYQAPVGPKPWHSPRQQSEYQQLQYSQKPQTTQQQWTQSQQQPIAQFGTMVPSEEWRTTNYQQLPSGGSTLVQEQEFHQQGVEPRTGYQYTRDMHAQRSYTHTGPTVTRNWGPPQQ